MQQSSQLGWADLGCFQKRMFVRWLRPLALGFRPATVGGPRRPASDFRRQTNVRSADAGAPIGYPRSDAAWRRQTILVESPARCATAAMRACHSSILIRAF
jgi:hypothetical protein